MYCIPHFYIVSLVLSCVLSTQNKRILYCIVISLHGDTAVIFIRPFSPTLGG